MAILLMLMLRLCWLDHKTIKYFSTSCRRRIFFANTIIC